ncbi:hypothetical protein FKM82_011543 [Ascaphus truei]
MSRQVEHLSRTFALSGCHIGAQSEQNHEFLAPLNSDTSHTAGVNLSSAVHIGQRLAVIGDELHRTYEQRFESKMALIVRASMRIANNCQAFALSVLRSVKHITSRVDPGGTRTAVNSPLMPATGPEPMYQNLLLAFALIVVSGTIIKLGLDD